ncbi:MAG: NTP transferase domain-containing protein [Candidatus Nomurabacteria bacterium]|jgi:UTP--glucose-1-phosphate uridylyltransferase|nr:NTP transferase domain-containing protein [Candidatus Nomurabacteria bacterium]
MGVKITKAIIPVAGYGTRRLPVTKAIEKCMLPIGNRPIVDYVVEDCVRAGITDIYFVINKTEHSQLKEYYSEDVELEKYLAERGKDVSVIKTAPEGVTFHYITQTGDKYGTAVPLALAAAEIGFDEQVVWCNGDDPFWNTPSGSEVKNMIDAVKTLDDAIAIGVVKPREEMSKYGMLVVENDQLTGLVEKPALENVVSSLANINRYIFSPKLFREIAEYVATHDQAPTERGEWEATDPIRDYVAGGGVIRVIPATGEWLDSGSLEGWLYANQVINSGKISLTN